MIHSVDRSDPVWIRFLKSDTMRGIRSRGVTEETIGSVLLGWKYPASSGLKRYTNESVIRKNKAMLPWCPG
jgi:hypothetical protein